MSNDQVLREGVAVSNEFVGRWQTPSRSLTSFCDSPGLFLIAELMNFSTVI